MTEPWRLGNPEGEQALAVAAFCQWHHKFDPRTPTVYPIFRQSHPTTTFEGTDIEALEFVESANTHRRNLTTGQRAVTALKIKDELQLLVRQGQRTDLTEVAGPERQKGKKKEKRSTSATGGRSEVETNDPEARRPRTKAAKSVNVGREPLRQAEVVRDNSPDLFKQLEDGRTTVKAAFTKVRQAQIAEQVKQAPPMPTGKFGVINADPPWQYDTETPDTVSRCGARPALVPA